MKAALLALGALLAGCATVGAPSTHDEPALVDGDVTSATVGGVQVLVKRVPGTGLAAGQLYILGGAQNWNAENAGIESLALATAVSGGTRHLDKDAFAQRLATLGTHLDSDTGLDWSSISFKCLQSSWDPGFAALADAFLDPAMPAAELELQRSKLLATVRQHADNPDQQLNSIFMKTFFAGHPYANPPEGTLETLPKLGAEAVAAHLQKLRQARRLLFVAVGDLDAPHVIEQVRAAFGALPPGERPAPLPSPAFVAPRLTSEKRELPTNYITAGFTTSRWGDPDFFTGIVAMNTLGYRLFDEIRVKRKLSYAPGGGDHWRLGVPYGELHVTAVDPTTTMKAMLEETQRFAAEPMDEKYLAGTTASYLTWTLIRAEPAEGQAELLAAFQILGGDWRLSRDFPRKLKAVTSADVQAYVKKKVVNLQTVLVGDPSKLAPSALKEGAQP